MIPIEKLRSIKTIISHAACPDGLASAMILHDVLPDAEIVFVQYNSPELAALQATPGMLFCDFCPPADRAKEFIEAGTIVLDHHKTAKDVVALFGPNGVFADEKEQPGVSGALLAYREVWKPLIQEIVPHKREEFDSTVRQLEAKMERFATLAGVRDTWQKKSPDWDEACAQASALLFWPQVLWLDAIPQEWDNLLKIGPMLLIKHAEKVEWAIQSAYRFTSAAGLRVVMFQGASSVASDTAEKLGEQADLVVGFSYQCESNEPKIIFRLRSRGAFDCSKFAKRYPPGGGHTGAAGFSLKIPVAPGATPYAYLQHLLNEHELGEAQAVTQDERSPS